uniref:Uncharacterized protein n=1 Tax=Chlamydomonas euryale TaxID=1486919 RepID=A0A7R9VSP2_9CHLO
MVGVAALAAGAVFAWRWWKQRQEQQQEKRREQQGGKAGTRSSFTFDKPVATATAASKFTFDKAGTTAPSAPKLAPAGRNAHRNRHAPPPPPTKKELRAAKQAKKDVKKTGATAAAVIDTPAARAYAQRQREEAAGTGLVTTIDFDKNADAYQRVKDWQETGKKKF